ncbi:MAG: ThuA domain-containing protein [Acidimicrobiales bacterium]
MTSVLLLTKGHPFDKAAFFAVFDALVADPASSVTSYTHVEQPAAQVFFDPERAAPYDVFVMYDMPGITFTGGDPPAVFADPPTSFVDGARALLDAGKGMVFLHHALAGWPAWEDWARIVGGRFHYQPARLDGVDYPDSGYHHGVTHTVEVVAPEHPIAAGLPASFAITDEVYLAPVFEADVDPVLASTHTFSDGNFWSADLAIRGQRYAREGWSHPPGSNLVGWVKHAGRSPVAYIQFGDGAETYADPNYRRVLANAVDWAASSDAHTWAAERCEATGRWA